MAKASEMLTKEEKDDPKASEELTGIGSAGLTKKLRMGRILLDYLRNDHASTAVAPLSPRARPGATVSMPLTWAQVRSDLDPKRYSVHTVPALLAKTSAWKDYCASERSLRTAIRKLVGKSG